jgi:predicted RND superfamily exporter protein
MFILLSISIDFGIYMASKNINKNSYKAVLYSLLSTFAGFGVLVFSHINALFSIGIIATLGIAAVTFLLILLKRSSYAIKNIK